MTQYTHVGFAPQHIVVLITLHTIYTDYLSSSYHTVYERQWHQLNRPRIDAHTQQMKTYVFLHDVLMASE